MLFDKLLQGDLATVGKYLGQAARLMVGLPDYDTYVRHRRLMHSELPLMTEVEFIRNRQEARYGSGRSGGCC
jgi:uncharacterized short protein YbdD (DUF466 family)